MKHAGMICTLGSVLAASSVVGLSGPGSGTPVVATAATTSALAATTTLIAVPFNGGKQRQINLGRKSLGAGDMFLTTGTPVRDDATGRGLGTLDGVETIIAPAHNGTASQQLTMRLAAGTLTLAGIIRHSDRHAALAITGGTGIYHSARGQLILQREDNTRKVTVFTLEILP
jgi:hypothetical protein